MLVLCYKLNTALWSNWLGRLPLKQEITGSNPVRVTFMNLRKINS
jgi:hypothetical protein